MASNGATLQDLHDAIQLAIAERLPNLATVRLYATGERIDTPAALIEFEGLEIGEDDDTDRTPLYCAVTVHCLLGHRTPDLDLQIRMFASEIMSLVWRNRWGLPTGAPEELEAGPGELSAGDMGYESWYVTWRQTLYVGASAWDDEGVIPDTIYVGYAPDIGEGHKPDYIQLRGQ